MSRIAYVSSARQIHLVEPDGRSSGLTSGASDIVYASWTAAAERYAHTWPAFSPGGDRVACFRLREGGDAGVLVTSLDGVVATEVIDLPDQVPIYLQWSQAGDRLAVVSQSGDDLLLTVGKPDQVGSQKILAKADRLAPLLGEGDRVTLPLRFGGTTDAPSFAPDLTALSAKARDELRNRAAEEIGEQATDKSKK